MNYGRCCIGTDCSFNRYMVECECLFKLCKQLIVLRVLIDTWWNVNVTKEEQVIVNDVF